MCPCDRDITVFPIVMRYIESTQRKDESGAVVSGPISGNGIELQRVVPAPVEGAVVVVECVLMKN